MAIIQKGYHSNEDYIDFINYAFGMNGASHSFPKLLPKLYGNGRESDKVTYFAIDDGKIVGTVGAFPLTFSVGGNTLSVRGIGSVATHPRRRGEGFMKSMMRKAIDDMIADGVDLSVLGGRRHRYRHFGFEKCDGMIYFSLTPKTVSYVSPDTEGLLMKPVDRNDAALLDELHKAMHNRPYHALRPREDLFDILCSWGSVPYAFFEGDTLVGWTVHYPSKGLLSEFCPLMPDRATGMLALACGRLGDLLVAVPAYDTALGEEVDTLAENATIVSQECFLVLNWQKVLSTLFTFKAAHTPLADGTLTVTIQGLQGNVTLTVAVENGVPSVTSTQEEASLTLSAAEAEALFFRGYSALRRKLSPAAASWLPVPLFIFAPDNV